MFPTCENDCKRSYLYVKVENALGPCCIAEWKAEDGIEARKGLPCLLWGYAQVDAKERAEQKHRVGNVFGSIRRVIDNLLI